LNERSFLSHSIKVIAGGFLALGLLVLVGRLLGPVDQTSSMAAAARWFIPLWLIASAINMWIGVRAGYSLLEEAPFFLLVFTLPASAAALLAWKLGHG
jgi:hypothetical protein